MKQLTPTTPHVIVMVGIPGSGKTHFAEHFAKTFSAPFLNQKELQRLAGCSEKQASELSARLLDELLKTQRTLIYEGPTHSQAFRRALAKKTVSAGYTPLFVWVQTESNEAKMRSRKAATPLNPEAHDALVKQFRRPDDSENVIVISGKHTYATQVKNVLRHLAGDNRPIAPPSRPQPPTGHHITVR